MRLLVDILSYVLWCSAFSSAIPEVVPGLPCPDGIELQLVENGLYPEEVALFCCDVRGIDLLWFVNGAGIVHQGIDPILSVPLSVPTSNVFAVLTERNLDPSPPIDQLGNRTSILLYVPEPADIGSSISLECGGGAGVGSCQRTVNFVSMPITSTTIEAETTEVESTPEGNTTEAEGTTTMERSPPSASAAGVSDGEAVGFGILTVSVIVLVTSQSVTVIYIVHIKRKTKSVHVETELQSKPEDNKA